MTAHNDSKFSPCQRFESALSGAPEGGWWGGLHSQALAVNAETPTDSWKGCQWALLVLLECSARWPPPELSLPLPNEVLAESTQTVNLSVGEGRVPCKWITVGRRRHGQHLTVFEKRPPLTHIATPRHMRHTHAHTHTYTHTHTHTHTHMDQLVAVRQFPLHHTCNEIQFSCANTTFFFLPLLFFFPSFTGVT